MRRRFRGFALESPRAIGAAGRWSKALLAGALGLGTVSAPLAFVNVAPASAAGPPTITAITPSSGLPAGGNKVVITGTGFSATVANDTVDFGPGNPATVTSGTAAKLTITAAPAGTGTVPVTVTVAGVTSNAVNYTYAPAPVVTALYSANAPTTGGTS